MTGITTYLSILTLNVNGLNSPIKSTVWKSGLKRKTQQFVAYCRPISSIEISITEDERLGENLPSQWPTKTGWSTNTYLWQSRLQTYIDQMKKRKTSHTNKRGNRPKGTNNCQSISTNVTAPNFIKHILKDLKACIKSSTVVVGNFRL
jgi:hypothetical protein